MLFIKSVKKGSPFYRAGIKKGESILAFDGHPFEDQLDLDFYSSETDFNVTIQGKNGVRTVRIQKDECEPLGISYPELEFEIKKCKNRCVFCFVEQCKKGMRDSLYVKDDDYRLSFTCGSYVTMSNMTQADLDRVARLKLSPLYVSVHCYDRKVKAKMCANPNSAKIFDYFDYLSPKGIKFHTQIVMVEGMNSDEILKETVSELYKRFPSIMSVAIVPVGLTGHRESLYPLDVVSKECAARTIDFIEDFAKKSLAETGTSFAWCSDEMYILAERPIPDSQYYEDFNQIENGVGEVASFFELANDELDNLNCPLSGEFTSVTGVAFGGLLKAYANKLEEKYPKLHIDVKIVENNWFGKSVTVAGLLTATDIIEQLKGNIKYKKLIIPSTMLKEFEDVFLDGISLKELEKTLGCRAHISGDGREFIKILEGKL